MEQALTNSRVPLINRIFFGFISCVFILAFLKMVHEFVSPAYIGNGDTPPLAHWVALFGLMIVGLVLITLYGDIRLRLHKIWTPIGLLIIFWVWLVTLADFLPVSHGVMDALLHHSYEAYIYATALGLLLAFVDLSVLYKYAYYFIPAAIFGLIGTVVGLFGIISIILGHNPALLHPTDPKFFAKWDEFNDFFWYVSGILFAYYIILRLKREWPGWKKIGLAIGVFILSFFFLAMINHIIGSAFPKDSRLGQWIKGDKPDNQEQNRVSITCPDNILYDQNSKMPIWVKGDERKNISGEEDQWIRENCRDFQK